MKVLIKIGGTLLDAAESRNRLASEIASAVYRGVQAVVVHGGGKQMTRYLTAHGIESRFVNGLRVTTPDVLDAVVKVLAGSVNQDLVSAFVACGAPAVGLSGMDALLTEARQMSVELGWVGQPVRSGRTSSTMSVPRSTDMRPATACAFRAGITSRSAAPKIVCVVDRLRGDSALPAPWREKQR